MSCIYCQETQPVPECVDSIIIGKVPPVSTPLHVFVKNVTTGYTYMQDVTSGPDGTIILDSTLPDKSFYNQNHLFEVWVTNITDMVKLPITIAGLTYSCLLVPFEKINQSDYTSYTVAV